MPSSSSRHRAHDLKKKPRKIRVHPAFVYWHTQLKNGFYPVASYNWVDGEVKEVTIRGGEPPIEIPACSTRAKEYRKAGEKMQALMNLLRNLKSPCRSDIDAPTKAAAEDFRTALILSCRRSPKFLVYVNSKYEMAICLREHIKIGCVVRVLYPL
jgi:hypothetical protein